MHSYRFDIIAGNESDMELVGVGRLQLRLPPLRVRVVEQAENIVLLDGQFLLCVSIVIVQGHEDLEERHSTSREVERGERKRRGRGEETR